VLGVVGRSGSGKSTLTKLVQRLYVPDSGRVLVDGTDIALDGRRASCAGQVGVVLQENLLFHRSVRENIAVTDPAAPLEAVMEAARLAGAHEFISELPEGYDTPVGEQGTGLSGGQRQRVAIARALFADPRILILDEATSALDYESEAILQRNMASICRGRTVIIIAHRLSRRAPRPPHRRHGGRAASPRRARATSCWPPAACTRGCGRCRRARRRRLLGEAPWNGPGRLPACRPLCTARKEAP
jgi:subfamily B ATP-binding cassette protein HlyB/CyaB